jgi:hypothetical protein
MHRKGGYPEGEWMSRFRRRNLEFRVAAPRGSGARRGPRGEPPIARDQGAAPRLSLGSGVAPLARRPQTARRQPTHTAAFSQWR